MNCDEAEDKRIVWRCRRGTKELDVMLSDYVNTVYFSLDHEDRRLFKEFLNLEDTQLTEWLVYRQPAAYPFQAIVADMLRLQDQRSGLP